MTKKQIAFAVAGVLTAGAALLYKCQDDSPVIPGKDGAVGNGGAAGAAGAAGASATVDAGTGGSR